MLRGDFEGNCDGDLDGDGDGDLDVRRISGEFPRWTQQFYIYIYICTLLFK